MHDAHTVNTPSDEETAYAETLIDFAHSMITGGEYVLSESQISELLSRAAALQNALNAGTTGKP